MKPTAKIFIGLLGAIMVFVFVFNYFTKDNIPTLNISATDLMAGVEADTVTTDPTSETFGPGFTTLSADIFKNTYTDQENILISPLSIVLALAMCENGAANNTLVQMEKLLLDMPVSRLNNDLKNYLDSLDDETILQISNSIWIRDDQDRITINPEFLKTNASYYRADGYLAPFDQSTLDDINNYIDYHTKGMIKKALDKVPLEAVMYLINTVLFESQWASEYTSDMVYKGKFTNANGTTSEVEFLHGNESLYLEDESLTGFVKKYKDERYGFVALLPKTDVATFLGELDGAKLHDLITNPQALPVTTATPKFKYGYKKELSGLLSSLGMVDAFSEIADFSKMATTASGALFISRVLHNCAIELNEIGTKAGAVTIVEIVDSAAIDNEKKVVLDRPFVYMIYDFQQEVPVFIGAVNSL